VACGLEIIPNMIRRGISKSNAAFRWLKGQNKQTRIGEGSARFRIS